MENLQNLFSLNQQKHYSISSSTNGQGSDHFTSFHPCLKTQEESWQKHLKLEFSIIATVHNLPKSIDRMVWNCTRLFCVSSALTASVSDEETLLYKMEKRLW